MVGDPVLSTEEQWYAERLKRLQSRRWKQILRVQAPYQWNLRRQHLGRTIDVGCGVGRNLSTLGPGSLGVDHNVAAVSEARRQGFDAVTADEFLAAEFVKVNEASGCQAAEGSAGWSAGRLIHASSGRARILGSVSLANRSGCARRAAARAAERCSATVLAWP